MKRLAILAALCLTGCATVQPKVTVQEVKVPVAVSCIVKDFADLPSTADTDDVLKAAPLDLALQLLLAGREVRDAWITSARTQIAICRQIEG